MQRQFRVMLMSVVLLAVPGRLLAQDDPDDYGPKPTGEAKVQAKYAADLKRYAEDEDKLVLPGILADRKDRSVAIMAEATGLSAGEAIEFLLVSSKSSHGYEAMLWAHARPSDVHRALEFIGLKAGAPVNPQAMRFWASGDRISVTVSEKNGSSEIPIEELIVNAESGEVLPEEGFIFTGSMRIASREDPSVMLYAADEYDPRSVASIYNEPCAVLDVPRQVSQTESYGSQVVNSEYVMQHGMLLTVMMRPADPEGKTRPREFKLEIGVSSSVTNGPVCRLTEKDKEPLSESPSMKPVLEKLVAFREQGEAPYVETWFGPSTAVSEVTKAAAMLAMMDSMGMIRLQPPAEGQLFCRAFVPDRQWINPEGRPSQPWELHLREEEGGVTGMLVRHEPVWRQDRVEPDYRRVTKPAASPQALAEALAADREMRSQNNDYSVPSVLLVYVPGRMPYDQVVTFASAVKETHGTVYVFTEEPEVPQHEEP